MCNFYMILLSWNIRGLRRPEKRSKVKSLVRVRKVDVLLIQETKRSSVDDNFVKSLWPWEELEYMEVGADRSAGGLLCLWNPQIFELKECCSARSFVILAGMAHHTFNCTIINVYAPNDVIKRRKLWEALATLNQSYLSPWCIGGDFNEIRFRSERKGCSTRERGMKDFNDFIDKLELVDMQMLGRQFTWCNAMDGNRWSRIDRFLIDPRWLEEFKFKQWGLPRCISDHCPILLIEDERDWGPKPFRFINAWCWHPKFKVEVKNCWEGYQVSGWASFRFLKKLGHLKVHLKKWNSEVFGNIEENLKKAEEELHEWDLIAEERNLLDAELKRRVEIRKLVWDLSKKKDWLWLQKSRRVWAENGDRNTRFFHLMATKRQRKNLLDSVNVNGVIQDEPGMIKRAVVRHFKLLFNEEWKNRPKLSGFFVSINSTDSAELLEA
ncbi:hypothetical protein CsSME_00007763 [Camellia sinensis var. sinensis]